MSSSSKREVTDLVCDLSGELTTYEVIMHADRGVYCLHICDDWQDVEIYLSSDRVNELIAQLLRIE